MTRKEIITMFRTENPEATDRVISDALLNDWCKVGDKEFCAITRCIKDFGTTIETTEDDTYLVLTDEIEKFFDIDEFGGGGVAYNGKRLGFTTMGELDTKSINWRSRSSGTPKEYYRINERLYYDRPIDSNAEDVTIYSILISDDFDDDDKTPYNGLTYLEPFHYGIVKYLQAKVKEKIGKKSEATSAREDFVNYAKWAKKEISGGRFGKIYLTPVK